MSHMGRPLRPEMLSSCPGVQERPVHSSRHKAEVASTDRDSDRRRPLESKFNVSTFGPILGADLPGRAYMTTDITLKSHEEQRRLLSVDSAMSPARAA
jgi:hypothetical protein